MANGPLSARLRQMRYMVGLLRYDEPQTLTPAQRTQARANIGAADAATAALAARRVNAKTGVKGGGDLTQDIDVEADIAAQAEAQAGTSNAKLMTLLRSAQAIDRMTVGRGQTWQNVTGGRQAGTSYQNTTGRPIMVSISGDPASSACACQVSVNNSAWVTVGYLGDVSGDGVNTASFIVPDGHYYRILSPVTVSAWAELR